jgi:tripartite-type tricarboxylate transporter receptor subunit TctC
MKGKSLIIVSAVCLGVFLLLISGIKAEAAFPEKNITFIIPVSPGGGFDTTVRLLIPYLQKYLPKRVTIIARNMPGGEWSVGINNLYRSEPTGYTIGIFNLPGNVVHMITGTAKFDLTKVTWLGTPADITYVTAFSPKSKFKSLKDMQEAPEVLAGTVGLASTAGLGTVLAAEAMKIKMKYIPHDGSTEAVLAGIRGDVDWVQYPFGTLKKHFEAGELIPKWVYAKQRLRELPNVPTIVEMGYGQLLSVVTMFRPIGGPPGIPGDVTKVLQTSLQKAIQDPEFVAAMKKGRLEPTYYGPEETTEMVNDSVKTFSQYKETLLKYLR